jgi:Nif-specific regulatory protein
MTFRADRIKNLSTSFAALLEQEQKACQEQIRRLIEAIRVIQGGSSDRRLQRLVAQLKSLQDRFELLTELGREDYLAKINREAEGLSVDMGDSKAIKIVLALIDSHSTSLNLFCERLLDLLNETTEAERGFLLFYAPESTEADVIAARNFQTTNLSLEEYSFSRTLLRDVFERAAPLMLEDASRDPVYSRETSVARFNLKSVVTVPLRHKERIIGAVYLENNKRPCAFDEETPRLLETVARFAVFYLDRAHLLPVTFKRQGGIFLDTSKASKEIIGQDQKILSLLETVGRLADSPATVLIEGESGTGKELIARALHYQSARRDQPFVAINCAAVPDSLLESELFGHEKGAFTGAIERYIGRIEQANGGTLFLDEISELAYPMQAKLLRFLQSSEVDRLGGKDTIRVDVRIVAATSKDLKSLMAEGRFQEALYYRLNVIPLQLPALRERRGDIPLLGDFFLRKFSTVYRKSVRIDAEVYDALSDYAFNGNVRELENLIHRLVALAEGDTIRPGDLPKEFLQIRAQRVSLEKDPIHKSLHTPARDLNELRRRKREIKQLLVEQEKQLIDRVLRQTNGNITEAALRLGVHRITLHKMMRKSKKEGPL